jgi:hypothetical protein
METPCSLKLFHDTYQKKYPESIPSQYHSERVKIAESLTPLPISSQTYGKINQLGFLPPLNSRSMSVARNNRLNEAIGNLAVGLG